MTKLPSHDASVVRASPVRRNGAGVLTNISVYLKEFERGPFSVEGMRLAKALAPLVSKYDSVHYVMPRRELLELLETTRAEDAPPRRLRVPIDRRAQKAPTLSSRLRRALRDDPHPPSA